MNHRYSGLKEGQGISHKMCWRRVKEFHTKCELLHWWVEQRVPPAEGKHQKRSSFTKDQSPPLQRIRQNSPPLQRIRQNSPPLQRIRQNSPPLQRIRQNSPPLQRIRVISAITKNGQSLYKGYVWVESSCLTCFYMKWHKQIFFTKF